MNPISKLRFDALAGYSRRPETYFYCVELAWFEQDYERLVGVIVRDNTDQDFAGVAMARDSKGRYRAVCTTPFFDDLQQAKEELEKTMIVEAGESDVSYYQGDETGKPLDFFQPQVKQVQLHSSFSEISSAEQWSHARGIMSAMMHYYDDPDGNFVEQFQTTGFDARLWELYLFASFAEQGFFFDRQYNAPDFLCKSPVGEFFAEAVTANPTILDGKNIEVGIPDTEVERKEYLDNYVPIKLGSALYSKLQKKYWNLKHIGGKPIVLALQDFHFPKSMTWTIPRLHEYLYGRRWKSRFDNAGLLIIESDKILNHQWAAKSIPSGFFDLPDAEHIAAVITNAQATINKFNRIGLKAGFGESEVQIVRLGNCANPDPRANKPMKFVFDVRSKNYVELWSEGMNVYHNPKAINPLAVELLPLAAHHFLENEQMRSIIPSDFQPFNSITIYGRSVADAQEQ